MTSPQSPYEELAQVIGEVVMEWTYIEGLVADMAINLASYRDRAYEDDPVRDPFIMAILCMKLPERIALTKALAHAVNDPPDYYARLERTLNVLDNALRIERNRFIHDSWHFHGSEIIRFAEGPKVVRPQAHRREISMGVKKNYANIEAVRAFHEELVTTRNCLVDLDNELASLMNEQDNAQAPKAH